MQLNQTPQTPLPYGGSRLFLLEALRVLKLSIVILFIGTQTWATAATQSITLTMRNGSIKDFFIEVNSQTGYEFLYNNQMIEKAKPVNLEIKNSPLHEALDKCFDNQPFTYNILETQNAIVIVDKPLTNKAQTSRVNETRQSQKIAIKGRITDIKGEPLPLASVMVEGTQIGTLTDLNGDFAVNVNSPDDVLVFSYIGYLTQKIKIGERRLFEIKLEVDLMELSEAVVIGYGRSSRNDLTGSIASLPEHVLETNQFSNIAEAIQGQLSGVHVLTGDGSPGATAQINIRGVSSMLGDASPLIVIDEVSMPAEFDLYEIDINTIASIDILKGASSAAIYGSRAASGVILITTKRGGKNEKPTINYSYDIKLSQLRTATNVLSAEEWKYMMLEGAYNGALWNGFADPEGWSTYNNMVQPGYFGEHNTNWFALMLQNAVSQTHSLSLRGGSANTTYTASLNYVDDQGVMKKTGFKRYTANFSINSRINKYISWGTSFRGSINDKEVATTTLYNSIMRGRPDIPAYNPDGSIAVSIYVLTDGRPNLRENPLSQLFDNDDISKTKSYNISNFLEVDILPGLKFKTMFSYNGSKTNTRQYYASTTSAGSGFAFAYRGRLYDGDRESEQTEFTNLLSYNKRVKKHNFDAVLGTSLLKEKNSYKRIWVEDFPDDHTQTQAWQGANIRGISGYIYTAAMISYVARLNYKFDDKYLFTASMRRDGSSKFASDNSYGSFPSIAVGWLINREKFLKNVKWLNLLKIRASVGSTGMANVGFYQWRTLYETTKYNNEPGVIPTQIGNDNLKWESTTQSDIGLDFRMFKHRISGSINYYSKITDGLLYPFTLAPSSGYRNATVNFAEISNKGFDIDLKADIIKSNIFNWTFNLNFNNNKNIVIKMDKDYITDLDGTQTYRNTIIQEGKSLGLIYGFKTDGVFRSQEEVDAYEALNPDKPYQGTSSSKAYPGEIKYVDLNGDGWVDLDTDIRNPDRTVVGKSMPDFSGGFSTILGYKNWSLNIYGSYSYGNDKVWSYEQSTFQANAASPGNMWKTVLKRWTPENPDSKYPSFRIGRTAPARWFNDYSVHDASYIKIQSVNLEYNFPKRLLDKLQYLSSLRVYARVTNLFVITNYPGPNPESFQSSRIQGASVDYSTYPESRNYIFGLKLTLK